MDIGTYLPFWKELTPQQQQALTSQATVRHFPKGTMVYGGGGDCAGLILPTQGQLRVYLLTEEGKELTLYRLFPRDLCLFSASCIMRGIQFDVQVSAERDTEAFHIPAPVYEQLMRTSAAVANYTNELMATRFSDVMWAMQQLLFISFDKRLAQYLWDESDHARAPVRATHEQIARDTGAVRETVTRMLRHFADDGVVSLGRGTVTVTDAQKLRSLAGM